MDTNDLQDRASKLLRALEDGDDGRARDMLHEDDALELALLLAHNVAPLGSPECATLRDVLAILAAERMARETLARATGGTVDEIERYKYTPDPNQEPAREDALEAEIAHGIVRDLAALDHGRAVAELYASDEDVEARR